MLAQTAWHAAPKLAWRWRNRDMLCESGGSCLSRALQRRSRAEFVTDWEICHPTRCRIGQRPQERNAEAVEAWNDALVGQPGRWQRCFAIVALGECRLRVGVDQALSIDASHALERADVERILRIALAERLGFERAMDIRMPHCRLGLVGRIGVLPV